jgi:hypothetical protein
MLFPMVQAPLVLVLARPQLGSALRLLVVLLTWMGLLAHLVLT